MPLAIGHQPLACHPDEKAIADDYFVCCAQSIEENKRKPKKQKKTANSHQLFLSQQVNESTNDSEPQHSPGGRYSEPQRAVSNPVHRTQWCAGIEKRQNTLPQPTTRRGVPQPLRQGLRFPSLTPKKPMANGISPTANGIFVRMASQWLMANS